MIAGLAGFVCGGLLGALFMARAGSDVQQPAAVKPFSGRLDETAISSICRMEGSTFEQSREAQLGIANAERLLPETRRLLVEYFQDAAGQYNIDLKALRQALQPTNKIVLDPQLGYSTAVSDEWPGEIHIGPGYALFLTSDDDAVVVLAHELTHISARRHRLRDLISGVSRSARLAGGVTPRRRQEEDLACDYTATQVLKRFIRLHPTGESTWGRLNEALGNESSAERLSHGWASFCDAYYASDQSDDDHLSATETVRALLGADPELVDLMVGLTPQSLRTPFYLQKQFEGKSRSKVP
jgi:hypothetical protein